MIITLIIIALTTTPSLLQAGPKPSPQTLTSSPTLKVLQGTVRRQLTEDLKRKVYIEDSKGTRFVLCSGEVSRKLVYYVGFTLNISYHEKPATDSSCLKAEQVVFLKLPGGKPAVQGILQKDPEKKAYFIKNNNPSSLSTLPKGPQVYFFSQLSPTLLTWFEKKRSLILDVVPDINKEGFYKIKAYYSDPLLMKKKLPSK